MPANFGSDTTWLKGKLNKNDGAICYFNLYQIAGIQQQNDDDYLITLHGGGSIMLYNCTQVDDLADIAPAAES